MAVFSGEWRFTMRFPIGIRFEPNDEELLLILKKKICGQWSRKDGSFVFEWDLYGKEEPWQIWNRVWPEYEKMFHKRIRKEGEDQDLYFFTNLKRKRTSQSRMERVVGSGTWHGVDSGREIVFEDVSGLMKRFSYKNLDSCHNGRWVMHEYSIRGNDDLVLCRVRKKANNSQDKETASSIDANSKENSRAEREKGVDDTSTSSPSPSPSPSEPLDEKKPCDHQVIKGDPIDFMGLLGPVSSVNQRDTDQGRNVGVEEIIPDASNAQDLGCDDATLRLGL